MKIAFRAGEIVDLQPLDLLLDRLRRREQRRHRDERAQVRGNAVAQLQSAAAASRRTAASRLRFTSATAEIERGDHAEGSRAEPAIPPSSPADAST